MFATLLELLLGTRQCVPWIVPAAPPLAGLLRLVSNEDELAAVLAHECAHVVAR